jgi:hypothetical protein
LIVPLWLILSYRFEGAWWQRSQVSWWILVGILSIGLALSQSRASYVGFAFSLLVAAALRYESSYGKTVVALIAVLGLVFFASVYAGLPLLPQTVTVRLASLSSPWSDPAMMPRYARWEYFFERAKVRPLLGHGLVADAATVAYFENYAVSPHNTFLFVAVKRGFLASGVLLFVTLVTIRRSARLLRSHEPLFRALGLAGVCGFFAQYIVGGFFDVQIDDFQLTVLFWILVAVISRSHELMMRREH